MKKYTKKTTLRSLLNKLLRVPRRILIEKTLTGLVIETQVFGNKKIIKVHDCN